MRCLAPKRLVPGRRCPGGLSQAAFAGSLAEFAVHNVSRRAHQYARRCGVPRNSRHQPQDCAAHGKSARHGVATPGAAQAWPAQRFYPFDCAGTQVAAILIPGAAPGVIITDEQGQRQPIISVEPENSGGHAGRIHRQEFAGIGCESVQFQATTKTGCGSARFESNRY